MNYLPRNNILVFYFFILPFTVFAQVEQRRFVELKSEPELRLAPGEEKQLIVSFLIKAGYHIQANRVNDENLIPTKLSFESAEGLIIGDPVYPDADEFKMEGVKEPLAVFGDTLEIQVPVRIAKPMDKEKILIKGQLYYQPCDASKCYFPRAFDFSVSIGVQ
jgi:hypothetical protein